MVASEVAITVSIELLARRAELSLGSPLVYRSLLALVLLAIIVRPARAEWLPRSSWVALLRVLTGGLTCDGPVWLAQSLGFPANKLGWYKSGRYGGEESNLPTMLLGGDSPQP
jgi:hypothetical protein